MTTQTAGTLGLTANTTADGQPRCNAALPDPAGSGTLIRCESAADSAPVAVAAEAPAHFAHDALGNVQHWTDKAEGARPHYEATTPAHAEGIERALDDAGVPALAPTGYTHEHRTFRLQRATDPTGVSGTGVVAEGVQFSDGRVALRWISARGKPSTACWDSLADMLEVHGHDGATTVEWT